MNSGAKMKKEESLPEGAELRRRAEADLEASVDESGDFSGVSSEDLQSLIHELRVHQVELKMQNEELRRIQGELEEARDRYAHLYDFAPVGYLTVNDKGIITEANLTAATLLGVDRSSLKGKPFSRFILNEDQDVYYLHRRQLLETQEPLYCRLRMVKQEGGEFYAGLDCMFVEKGDGGPEQIRMVVSDITEQKDLEDQLRQAQKMEAIGTLAGGIAHDFNNILAAMIGFAELALDQAPKGTNLEDNLQEILIGGKRAKLLVQQILTFSRKAPQKQVPLRLDALVRETARLIRSTLPANITIEVEIKTTMDPWVMGNESQINQVVMNLCTNAGHAMEAEGGKLTISIDDIVLDHAKADHSLNLPPGKYVKFTVSDTGVGMAPEIVERIFEPYFSTKAPDKGSGMGLSVVEGIVKTHDGHIFAMTQLQKGSTFTVYWPRLEKSPSDPHPRPLGKLPGGSEHILFIDDELPIVKLIKMMLEKLGYTVTTGTSSRQALESFRAAPGRFDLVITDMTMPEMTGDRLAVELTKIRPDIPVIICSGYRKDMSEEQAGQIGIKAYVGKPVDKVELAETIREVLDAANRSASGQGPIR
jgi:PAS domain S-box-containing protein